MDPHPKARTANALIAGACWVALAPMVAFAAARLVHLDDRSALLFAAQTLTLYVYAPAWVVVAVAALVLRRRALAAVAATVVIAHAVWVWDDLPLPWRGSEDVTGVAFTLVTANLLVTNEDPAALDAIAALEPDVLVVIELTPGMAKRIEADPRFAHLERRVTDPRPDTTGSGIYSRYSLVDPRRVEIGGAPAVRARLRVTPSVSGPLDLVAVHTVQPFVDLGALRATLDQLPSHVPPSDEPAVIAGDFNATSQHRPFRRMLERTGYRDAHAVVGRGLATTWRVGGPLPPLALLDHIVVSDAVAVLRVREAHVPGSDHRAVAATLALPSASA